MPLFTNLRIRQLIIPRREDLHRAGFKLGYLCLQVERVIGQQIRDCREISL
jgi:hypothetical protein